MSWGLTGNAQWGFLIEQHGRRDTERAPREKCGSFC